MSNQYWDPTRGAWVTNTQTNPYANYSDSEMLAAQGLVQLSRGQPPVNQGYERPTIPWSSEERAALAALLNQDIHFQRSYDQLAAELNAQFRYRAPRTARAVRATASTHAEVRPAWVARQQRFGSSQ